MDLFKHVPKGECPLCLIPLPNDSTEITYETCCGKFICNGCVWKHDEVLDKINAERALEDLPKPPLELSCAFCRKPTATSDEEDMERVKHRMALGDAEAFGFMGGIYRFGDHGLTRDEGKAFIELYLRAADLGSANACYNVSVCHRDGMGIERDASKEEHYLKLAAKKGHVKARHNLGCLERNRGKNQVAVKHFMISASAGDDESLKNIGMAYRKYCATKDQYETAIRANKDAKEAMSSEERDKAKAARANGLL